MILTRVQHHPARAKIVNRLLAGLDSLDVEIVRHQSDPPSPWLGYLACLQDLPSRYTHLLVIQDDAIVCRNFGAALERVAEANPDTPVCLFVPNIKMSTHKAYREAIRRHRRYATVHWRDFLPVVATLWPIEQARAFALWSENAHIVSLRRPWRSDDAVAGAWMGQRRALVRATVPSLVEHPDDVPPVKSDKAASGRCALHFIGDADPLDLDWSTV